MGQVWVSGRALEWKPKSGVVCLVPATSSITSGVSGRVDEQQSS